MGKNLDGSGSNPRISKRLHRALALIVHDGKSVAEAANIAGYKLTSLQRALLKPHVRLARDALRGELREADRDVNFHVLRDLRQHATSEYVRADLAKHLGAIYGDKPKSDGLPAGGGGGISLNITFKHVVQGSIGAPSVQPQIVDAQVIDDEGSTRPERVLAEALPEPDEGGTGSKR